MFDRVPPRYLLPNSFTAVSLLLGVGAIVVAGDGSLGPGRFQSAAWLIVWCCLLDKLDGVAARLANASSEFGVQFDSLADLVAFCVAPALLVYFLLTGDPRLEDTFSAGPAKMALLVSVALYIALGAARLARFNITTEDIGPFWFQGMPTTVAGALVASLVLTCIALRAPAGIYMGLPFFLAACAVLMVSNLWLPKAARREARWFNAVQLVLAGVIYVLGIARALPWLLFLIGVTYVFVGFAVGALRHPRPKEA
jgi:CDP-diacylglycerol--serine O-phosphatidyltransferase